MSRQALYRAYRPRSFEEVVGQSRVVMTLREAVRQRRLTHAYLFSGPRGTGKTSIARILAKAVNCENLSPSGDPCLQCASCVALERGNHLDVIEIDAASNRGIDEIRDLREHLGQAPVMGKQRVYIIDEVHMLTEPAFNALLKTLEEPPEHVLFVLATTESHKLPITVLSRCQRYEFQRFRVGEIQERLRQVAAHEKIPISPEALELLAEFGDGALRDALSLLDQVSSSVGVEITRDHIENMVGALSPALLEETVSALTADTLSALILAIDHALQEGRDPRQMLRDVARELRNLVVWREAGPDLFPSYRRDWLGRLDGMVPDNILPRVWFESLDILTEGEGRLKSGFPPQLVLELALFKTRQHLLQSGRPEMRAPLLDEAGSTYVQPSRSVSASVSAEMPPVNSEKFQQALEFIRRERPSTYALVKEARCRTKGNGLELCFAFPAHLDLMKSGTNHDLLERALKHIYGDEISYTLTTESSEDPAENAVVDSREPMVETVNRSDVAANAREWFGEDIHLIGFE
ncbi:MAG: DNA polymerase III subunit gamma/tau [Firmicutes bacterium]|nr:DNA polymerase III subunit gamma/tau [Bacillota bacterium]